MVHHPTIILPALKAKLVIGSYKEGQVMLGNQIAVLKGAKNPNAGKLLVEFLLTKEGSDLFVEGEAIYSFRKGYKAPAAAAPGAGAPRTAAHFRKGQCNFYEWACMGTSALFWYCGASALGRRTFCDAQAYHNHWMAYTFVKNQNSWFQKQ